MTGQQLRIDGRWASSVAAWGDLGWSTQIRGGMHEISWSMDVDTSFRHPALRVGSLVEIYDGPARLGLGVMNEPDLVSGQFVARGLYRVAENYLALDEDGNGSAVPNVAIDAAIARGLPWLRDTSFSNIPLTASGPTQGSNRLNTLLDSFSDFASAHWGVDENQQVSLRPLATTPTWYLRPGLTDLGLAEDEYASDLFGRRLASGGTFVVETRGDPVARMAFERREEPVDLTSLGIITAGKAQNILAGLLAKGRARPAFTTSVDVSANDLLTVSGVQADLSMVQAGQMVRSHGFYDDITYLNGQTYLDWLIGETSYEAGATTIALAPMGLAPRDLAAVLAALPARSTFQA